MVPTLRLLAQEEQAARLKQVQPSQPKAASGSPPEQAAQARTKEERERQRFSYNWACFSQQSPVIRDPTQLPSPSMVSVFPPYEEGVGGSGIVLPPLTKVLGAGRQLDVLPGRDSKMTDAYVAYTALAIAYATPLPESVKRDEGLDLKVLSVQDTDGTTMEVAPALCAGAVDVFLNHLSAAISPLTPNQQDEHLKAIWNELIAQHSTRGASVTVALAHTLTSDAFLQARKETRKAAPSLLKKERAPERKTERKQERKLERKSGRESEGKSVSDLPVCPTLKKTGWCEAYGNYECNKFKHPRGLIKRKKAKADSDGDDD